LADKQASFTAFTRNDGASFQSFRIPKDRDEGISVVRSVKKIAALIPVNRDSLAMTGDYETILHLHNDKQE